MLIPSLIGTAIIGLMCSACSSESPDQPAAELAPPVGAAPLDVDKNDAGNAKEKVVLPRGGRIDEDVNMFSPKEVMGKLRPRPNLVTYQ